MSGPIIVYAISALSIVLGFIALLAQKVYLDPKTNEPSEIEVPIFGKLRTNIPAIVFVFLGTILAFITLEKSFPPKRVQWIINGSFQPALDANIRWPEGALAVVPWDVEQTVSTNGAFKIVLSLEEGKAFEDVIQVIDYSHPLGSAQIQPAVELKRRTQGDTSSLLQVAGPTVRRYKPVALTLFPK